MHTSSRLVLVSLTLLCGLAQDQRMVAQEKQGEVKQRPDAAVMQQVDKRKIAVAKQPQLTELQQLQQRVDALEKEVELLRQHEPAPGGAVAPVKRLPRDGGKADSPDAMQLQVNRLWDQVSLILNKLDELARR